MSSFNVSELLQSRNKQLLGYAYKLSDAGSYGYDVSIGEMDIDEANMAITIPFASGERRDGVGDLLEVAGINTERHRRNPVVLFDHGKQVTLPVGLAEDPKSKAYTIRIDPDQRMAWCKAYFYQSALQKDHATFCEQLFDLMAKRYVRAGSIGYQVIHARELQPDYDRGVPKGLHLLNTLMLEASAVVMPANMDTVRKALALPQVCGKPLSPYLVKSLTPYAQQYTKTTVGIMAQGLAHSGPLPTSPTNHSPVPEFKSVRDLYKKKSLIKPVVKSIVPSVSDIKNCLKAAGIDVLTITQVAGSTTLKVIVDRLQVIAARRAIQQSGYTDLQVIVEGGDKAMDIKDIRSIYKKKSLKQEDEKAIVGSGNVSDYVIGGNVAARTQLFFYPGGKTTAFAKPGEKLKVVEVESNGMVKVRRADGQVASFSSAEVRKTKQLDKPKEDRKNIRLQYRKSKGFRRVLKKGVSGSSMVYVSNKDLESVKKLASDRGLEAKYIGTKNGLEKVRLTGDEKAMDEVAKAYGRPMKAFAKKSMDAKDKAGPNDRIRYNQQVMSELRKISQEHADALNSRGSVLGWWNTVDYYRTSRQTPKACAEKIASQQVKSLGEKALILDPSKPQKQNMTRRQVAEQWLKNKQQLRAYFESQGATPGLIERLESEMSSGKYPWEMSLETREQERKVASLLVLNS